MCTFTETGKGEKGEVGMWGRFRDLLIGEETDGEGVRGLFSESEKCVCVCAIDITQEGRKTVGSG